MFVTNAEALKDAPFEPIVVHQVDENGQPIYRGDGSGIDYSKVKGPE